MLVKADISKTQRGKKSLSPRSLFCDRMLDEFVESGLDCAEVTEYEEYGTTYQIASAFNNRIRSKLFNEVRSMVRSGSIYLVREGRDE